MVEIVGGETIGEPGTWRYRIADYQEACFQAALSNDASLDDEIAAGNRAFKPQATPISRYRLPDVAVHQPFVFSAPGLIKLLYSVPELERYRGNIRINVGALDITRLTDTATCRCSNHTSTFVKQTANRDAVQSQSCSAPGYWPNGRICFHDVYHAEA